MNSPLARIIDERNALYANPRGPNGTLSRRQKARSAELSAEYADWAKSLPDPPATPTPTPAPTKHRRFSSVEAFEKAIDAAGGSLDDPAATAAHVGKALDELDALDRYPRLVTYDDLKALNRPADAVPTPIADGSNWR